MTAWLRARIEDLRAALVDPGRPLPPWVWFGLAALVSLSFFLWLRLVAVRMAPPERPAPAPSASPWPTSAPAATPLPKPERGHIAERVEAWRRLREARELRPWLALHSRCFGAAGMDLAGLAGRAASEMSERTELSLKLTGLEIQLGDAVAIARFTETRTEDAREQSSQVRLYFLFEDGEWRVFNTERQTLERGSESP